MHVQCTCQQCGAEFLVPPSRMRNQDRPPRFCSRACTAVHQRGRRLKPPEVISCATCGIEVLLFPSRVNRPGARAAKYCGAACAFKGQKLNRPIWNAGQSKETDPRLARMAEATRQFYRDNPGARSGEAHPFYGRSHTDEANARNRAAHVGATINAAQRAGLALGRRFWPTARRETGIERKMRLALDAAGVSFDPQYPVGRFSIDFAFPEARLAVEVDGAYWHTPERDARRDAALQQLGWRVLHFTEIRVNRDIHGCITELLQTLESRSDGGGELG